MRHLYSVTHDPPAPVVPIRVSVPGRPDRGVALVALVDSGADVTVIPAAVATAIGLPPTGLLRAAGVTGVVGNAIVYAAGVEIDGLRRAVEVIGLGEEALLGRNLLNQVVLALDGPGLQLEVVV